jgi:hypothetical protein
MKRILLIIVILTGVFAGCSSDSGNPVSGGLTTLESQTEIANILVADRDSSGSTGLFGAWNLILSDNNTAELIPMRQSSSGESYIVNGISYFTSTPCPDCLRIKTIGLDNSGNPILTFQVRHPYPKGNPSKEASVKNRLDLDIFDLALIVKPVGIESKFYQQSETSIFPQVMLNPDGYTSEITKIIGSNAALPFKICYESPDYNRFEMGTDWQDFDVILKGGQTNQFDLYLTMGYGSNPFTSRLNPVYYNPQFNRKAAWKVEVESQPWIDYDASTVTINIYDWNQWADVADKYPDPKNTHHIKAKSDIQLVTVEIPRMTQEIVEAYSSDTTTNGWDDPITYTVSFSNENCIPTGEYCGLVTVKDSYPSGTSGFDSSLVSPDQDMKLKQYMISSFVTYQTFKASVIFNAIGIPRNPVVVDIKKYLYLQDSLDIKVDNDLAYVLDRVYGVAIFNINNPSVPIKLSDMQVENPIDYEIDNGYLYCVSNVLGAKIYDIRNLSNPRFVGTVEDSGNTVQMAVIGNTGCIIKSNGIMLMYDFSNPEEPVYRGEVPIFLDMIDLQEHGDDFYVITRNNMLLVDYSDPVHPRISQSINIDNIVDVVFENNLAYVLTSSGVKIIDISEPSHPQVILNNFPCYASHIRKSEDKLYLMNLNMLMVVDISNPAVPVIHAQMTTGKTINMDVCQDIVYMACEGEGISIVHTGLAATPRIVNKISRLMPSKVEIRDHFAYIGERDYEDLSAHANGFAIMDLTDPEKPLPISWVKTAPVMSMVIKGNYAYLATGWYRQERPDTGFAIIDISNPYAPFLVGKEYGFKSYGVDVADNGYAYVSEEEGLRVYNLSNPEHPYRVYEEEFVYGLGVKIVGNFAYVGTWEGPMYIYDISDPDEPLRIGSMDIQSVNSMSIENNMMYLSSANHGLYAVDITQPSDPVIHGHYEYFQPLDVRVRDCFVYMGFISEPPRDPYNPPPPPGCECMHIFDVHDPDQPVYMTTVISNHPTMGVGLYKNYAYMAEGVDGMIIVKLWGL